MVVLLITSICYFYFGYFISRQDFGLLFGLYSVVFIAFVYFINMYKTNKDLFKIGLYFRLIFLLSTPFFSQDFYRFIWDGRLIIYGINPYEFLPNDIVSSLTNRYQFQLLFNKMGSLSSSHFSNYPPVNQFLFAVAGYFSRNSVLGSILIFRTIIIFADIGIYYFGQKLLVHFKQNPNKIFLYFLNPLVILELTGNLHFEGVMLFFLVLSFYFSTKNNWVLASLLIGISISVKLLPLLILPLFWQKLGFKKSILFYLFVIFFNLMFFLPFINNHIVDNYLETILLWFNNFEFNASFYYIIREIGFYVKGYNIIGTVGKLIPVVTILFILYYAFFRKNKKVENIINNSLIVFALYFFISTTVHPWYVINLVLLSVFTNYKFPIVWSFSIILSYFAYRSEIFKENFFLISLEYILVFSFIIFENAKIQSLKKIS
ncbi:MAG: polyprenol phosphomannose-dependent alpha 1,6 mannosyltransferase MptB [Flavobacterium sp.]|nr:polyprenol phosphomannose-dependent alpha 1,6 mannosyltransferase MptB [Flavobacterium sp.]